jgi:hypothetical protein
MEAMERMKASGESLVTAQEIAAAWNSTPEHVHNIARRDGWRRLNIGTGSRPAWRYFESDAVDYLVRATQSR